MDRTTTNRQIDNHGARIQQLFSSVLLLLKEKKKKILKGKEGLNIHPKKLKYNKTNIKQNI